MPSFTQRYERPTSYDQLPFNVKNYIRDNESGWNSCVLGKVGSTGEPDDQCNVLANCTGYAQGRFNEIYNEVKGTTGMHFYWFNNNASGWVDRKNAHYPDLVLDLTPAAASIMCWSGGSGHVAIVEEDRYRIDGTLIITDSSWNGEVFRRYSIDNSNGNWGRSSDYTFQGFIHFPDYEPTPSGDFGRLKWQDYSHRIL